VEASKNAKLGDCSATYVSFASCWTGCAFYGKGCYGGHDLTGLQERQLRRATLGGKFAGPVARGAGSGKKTPDARRIARDEARVIDALIGARPLRLHVVGDCRTVSAAQILARAADRYIKRSKAHYRGLLGRLAAKGWPGMPVWSYCHTWRTIARQAWGKISILASCETRADVAAAMKRGYAAALVVESHPADGKAWVADGVKFVPCPNQTRGVTCRECRLCFDDAALRAAKSVITFRVHGGGKEQAREALIQIQASESARSTARRVMGIQ
jgi:hypothetical protein